MFRGPSYQVPVLHHLKKYHDILLLECHYYIYPVLHKLEADGHIKTEVEYVGKRVRKYYSLTETGRSWTEQKIDEFFDFVNTLTYVLKPTPA